MIKITDNVVKQTLSTVKTIGLCAIAGAEVGYAIASVEGAKIGAITGAVVGTGVLLYLAYEEHRADRESPGEPRLIPYPYPFAEPA